MQKKLPFLAAAVALIGLGLGMSPALQAADSFPRKPLRIIVPYPPGGSNDLLSRFLGVKLTDRLKQQVIIDNRGGANGIIGTHLAAQASADGYNLLIVSISFTMNAAVHKLPYDIVKDFDMIATIGKSPNSVVVNPGWGVKTVKELVTRAKAKPGSIAYASTGVGGFNHFGGELFKRITGVDLLHVPYKGGGPAIVDTIAGQVPMMFSSLTQILPHVRSGRLNIIAIGAKERSAVVPDVPTMIESGYPDYEMYVWWGFAAPHGVPKPVLTRLGQEFRAILNDPATQKRLELEAAQPMDLSPAEFRKLIQDERRKWTAVAKSAGIAAN
jgi:tripartite-type tricarboxylate transporter receptor subunit TctC